MRIAVFPGTFDPITIGHEDLIKRSSALFDKVIVAVGKNSQKSTMFTIEQRIEWLNDAFSNVENVIVDSYTGLTVKYCKKMKAKFIIRGLRNASDFEYEKQIGQMNLIVSKGIDTVSLISRPEFSHISSSIVRELIRNNTDVSTLIPKTIKFNIK